MGEAPGKIIICGEHFCVYGAAAVSAAINLYSRASVLEGEHEGVAVSSLNLGVSGVFQNSRYTPLKGGEAGRSPLEPIYVAVRGVLASAGSGKDALKVEVESRLPIRVGLGSSASIFVAAAKATARFLGLNLPTGRICEAAYAAESLVHGKPSGIDHTTVAYGGILLYRANMGFEKIAPKERLNILVGNTKVTRPTGEFVVRVRRRVEKGDPTLRSLIAECDQLSLVASECLKSGRLSKLGRLMSRNHELLRLLGVSSEALDLYVAEALRAGALGAKLTGGGGGGCVIALVDERSAESVASSLRKLGGDVYAVEVDEEGARAWVEG